MERGGPLHPTGRTQDDSTSPPRDCWSGPLSDSDRVERTGGRYFLTLAVRRVRIAVPKPRRSHRTDSMAMAGRATGAALPKNALRIRFRLSCDRTEGGSCSPTAHNYTACDADQSFYRAWICPNRCLYATARPTMCPWKRSTPVAKRLSTAPARLLAGRPVTELPSSFGRGLLREEDLAGDYPVADYRTPGPTIAREELVVGGPPG